MNVSIVYYSYSGNTHKAAEIAEEILQAQGHSVTRLRIKCDEPYDFLLSFVFRCLRAATKQITRIDSIETNLTAYDLVLFATPVWAREMTPAMRTYLGRVSGLSTKKVILFVTYGSGLGKGHCLDSLQHAIEGKGAICIGRFSLSQFKINDKALIKKLLQENMCL